MRPARDMKPDRANPRTVRRRLFGLMMLVAGIFLLGKAAAIRADGLAWQAAQSARFESGPAPPPSSERPAPLPGDAVGRLRIDRLAIDVMVVEGISEVNLALGPGRLRESALPGEADNCIIAGHRDKDFRALRSIQEGDLVQLNGPGGDWTYRVVAIHIVDREETDLLASTGEARLTLITCYPFYYVGPAPQRFIVQGELVGGGARGEIDPPGGPGDRSF